MLREIKLNLTFSHHCVNPHCNAPLYKELMRSPDQEACDECDGPREGLPTAFSIAFVPREQLPFLQGRCSEPCCIKDSVLAEYHRRDTRETVTCVNCGACYRKDEALRFMDGLRCRGGCVKF